jgi:hypothetical protein
MCSLYKINFGKASVCRIVSQGDSVTCAWRKHIPLWGPVYTSMYLIKPCSHWRYSCLTSFRGNPLHPLSFLSRATNGYCRARICLYLGEYCVRNHRWRSVGQRIARNRATWIEAAANSSILNWYIRDQLIKFTGTRWIIKLRYDAWKPEYDHLLGNASLSTFPWQRGIDRCCTTVW